MIFVTIFKTADEHQDEPETTFIFMEEVQNCPAVWDISSAKILKTGKGNKRLVEASLIHVQNSFDGRGISASEALGRASSSVKGGISADIQFRSNLSAVSPPLLFLLR